ncbi:CehA/McbA family metallohydrolase [Litorivivens sp.]|uniref:CehA/McbA family metallohydrolase n=5 Tax=Litorivivens sp. TaxID=2020868 RepID=UPI003565AA67
MKSITLGKWRSLCAVTLVWAGIASPAGADYAAFQLDAANMASAARGGVDAIAGRGDWWLTNGTLCAAISDVEHDAGIVAGGGSLIDFGFCGRDDDQWTYANLLTGLAKEKAIRASEILAKSGASKAEVVVVGEDGGLRQTLRYVFSESDPSALSLWVEVERLAPGRPVRLSGLLTLYPHRALTPYTLSTIAPNYSIGFDHPYVDRHSMFSLTAGMMPADWNILVGSHVEPAPLSYGVQLASAYLTDRDGVDHRLPQFLVTLPDYSLHGWMTRPLWLGSEKLGMMQMLQSQLMDLKVGERMVVHFRMLVGAAADVAAATDQIYQGPTLRGSVNTAPVSLEVFADDGRSVSQRRVEYPGEFSLTLPKELMKARVVARSPWGETVELNQRIAGDTDLGAVVFRERTELRLPAGKAMKLSFFGLGNTPTPRLGDDLLNFRNKGQPVEHSLVSNSVSLAGVRSDPRVVFLPPGEYEVLASRGLEHSVTTTRLELKPGEVTSLEIDAPQRLLESDWVSADFHVHAGQSFDSTLPLTERFRTFAAQDAKLLVLSEHNRIVDGREALASLALDTPITLITGSELTGMARTPVAPTSLGHSNIFPVAERNELFAGGAPRVEDRRLRDLITDTRYRYPGAIFQLNHPRSQDAIDSDLSYFNHLSQAKPFEPVLPLTHPRNHSLLEPASSGFRDIDFDAMEILNGAEMDAFPIALRDWLSLLNQGYRIRATGNSDSHGMDEVVSVPRNYVKLAADAESSPETALVRAVRAGELFLTSGPLLSITHNGDNAMGQELQGGSIALTIRVDAVPWVDVSTLRLYVNGRTYLERSIVPGQDYSEIVHVKRDSVAVVEVSGEAGRVYQKLFPGLQPVAVSNPVYIDADSDGQWLPPGVP